MIVGGSAEGAGGRTGGGAGVAVGKAAAGGAIGDDIASPDGVGTTAAGAAAVTVAVEDEA